MKKEKVLQVVKVVAVVVLPGGIPVWIAYKIYNKWFKKE